MKDIPRCISSPWQALSVPVEGRLYKLLASIGRVGSNSCVCVCVCDSVANDASLTVA